MRLVWLQVRLEAVVGRRCHGRRAQAAKKIGPTNSNDGASYMCSTWSSCSRVCTPAAIRRSLCPGILPPRLKKRASESPPRPNPTVPLYPKFSNPRRSTRPGRRRLHNFEDRPQFPHRVHVAEDDGSSESPLHLDTDPFALQCGNHLVMVVHHSEIDVVDAFVYFNNDFEGNAVRDAVTLAEMILESRFRNCPLIN